MGVYLDDDFLLEADQRRNKEGAKGRTLKKTRKRRGKGRTEDERKREETRGNDRTGKETRGDERKGKTTRRD